MTPQRSKILWYIIGVVVLLVIIGSVLYAAHFSKHESITQQPAIVKPNVTQTAVDPKTLPQDFPANIPLEKGATVTQNYNAQSISGQYQATRAFESKKSVADNDKLYT